MTPTLPPTRFTLRDLSLPSRLVLTVFLIAVGVGYFSALVQLHLQHSSREGEPLPTPADVVEVFAGLKKADPTAPPAGAPVSKLEKLVMGPIEGAPWNGSGSMAAAFFHKDGGEFNRFVAAGGDKAGLTAERDGERQFVKAWICTEPEARGNAFRDDALPVPDDLAATPITPKDLAAAGVKVKSILLERCARCHAAGAAQEQYPLETLDELLKYMKVPNDRPPPPPGWVWSDRQMSVEKLTQSTHAHLLSFAVLFTLTGLIFTFTRYPAVVRGVLGPLVLVAEVADVSCWWLARVPDIGPYFALAIIGTGTVGGLGLLAQILGSLWDMYGAKGRAVLGLIAALLVAGFSGLLLPKIAEELSKQKETAEKAKVAANVPKLVPKEVAKPGVSELEALITGSRQGAPWERGGSMAPAFFHKDGGEFNRQVKVREKEVTAEREGEQAAVAAWLRLDDTARKGAYEADSFALPADRVGKPITPDYLADDTHVKVQSILTDRCARCHVEGGDQAGEYPLETYDQLKKYFGPPPAGGK